MAIHAKRKPGEKKLPSVRQVGHGKLHARKLTPTQREKLRRDGVIYITIRGQRKRVTPANVRNGHIFWYYRSDSGRRKKICLRNFERDYAYPARHRAVKGKPFTGD